MFWAFSLILLLILILALTAKQKYRMNHSQVKQQVTDKGKTQVPCLILQHLTYWMSHSALQCPSKHSSAYTPFFAMQQHVQMLKIRNRMKELSLNYQIITICIQNPLQLAYLYVSRISRFLPLCS